VKSSPSSSLDISINTISFICIDFAGLPVLPGLLERPLLQRLLNAHVWSQAASDREVPPEVDERRVQIVLAGDKLPQHWSHRNIHARQAGRNSEWVDPAKGNVVPRGQVRQLEEVPRGPDVVVLEPVPVIFVSASVPFSWSCVRSGLCQIVLWLVNSTPVCESRNVVRNIRINLQSLRARRRTAVAVPFSFFRTQWNLRSPGVK
jgi:hypothetical protein